MVSVLEHEKEGFSLSPNEMQLNFSSRDCRERRIVKRKLNPEKSRETETETETCELRIEPSFRIQPPRLIPGNRSHRFFGERKEIYPRKMSPLRRQTCDGSASEGRNGINRDMFNLSCAG